MMVYGTRFGQAVNVRCSLGCGTVVLYLGDLHEQVGGLERTMEFYEEALPSPPSPRWTLKCITVFSFV